MILLCVIFLGCKRMPLNRKVFAPPHGRFGCQYIANQANRALEFLMCGSSTRGPTNRYRHVFSEERRFHTGYILGS